MGSLALHNGQSRFFFLFILSTPFKSCDTHLMGSRSQKWEKILNRKFVSICLLLCLLRSAKSIEPHFSNGRSKKAVEKWNKKHLALETRWLMENRDAASVCLSLVSVHFCGRFIRREHAIATIKRQTFMCVFFYWPRIVRSIKTEM